MTKRQIRRSRKPGQSVLCNCTGISGWLASLMGTNRLEAFSDGVLAIIITIMVLELKVPHAAGLADIKPLLPVFLSYVLSFIYVGIYWSNHHHMLQVTKRSTGGILWANLHLLFWLSLFPFTTGWVGENHLAPTPTAIYGAVLLLAGIAYFILQHTIIKSPHMKYFRRLCSTYPETKNMSMKQACVNRLIHLVLEALLIRLSAK